MLARSARGSEARTSRMEQKEPCWAIIRAGNLLQAALRELSSRQLGSGPARARYTRSSWDGCFATPGNGKQRAIAATGIALGTDGRSGCLWSEFGVFLFV